MDNVTFFTNEIDKEYALINHGNEQFTSMPKDLYDAQQAEHFTPSLPA